MGEDRRGKTNKLTKMVRSNREEVNIKMQMWREFEEIILMGVEKLIALMVEQKNQMFM